MNTWVIAVNIPGTRRRHTNEEIIFADTGLRSLVMLTDTAAEGNVIPLLLFCSHCPGCLDANGNFINLEKFPAHLTTLSGETIPSALYSELQSLLAHS